MKFAQYILEQLEHIQGNHGGSIYCGLSYCGPIRMVDGTIETEFADTSKTAEQKKTASLHRPETPHVPCYYQEKILGCFYCRSLHTQRTRTKEN